MVTSKKGDTLHKPSADPVYLTQCQTLLLCQSVKLLTHRRLERKEVSLRVDFGAWVSTSITREHAIAGSCVPTSSDSMRSWISAQAVPPEARISMWRFTSSTECCGKDGTSTQPRRSPHAKTRRSRRHHHHGAPCVLQESQTTVLCPVTVTAQRSLRAPCIPSPPAKRAKRHESEVPRNRLRRCKHRDITPTTHRLEVRFRREERPALPVEHLGSFPEGCALRSPRRAFGGRHVS